MIPKGDNSGSAASVLIEWILPLNFISCTPSFPFVTFWHKGRAEPIPHGLPADFQGLEPGNL